MLQAGFLLPGYCLLSAPHIATVLRNRHFWLAKWALLACEIGILTL